MSAALAALTVPAITVAAESGAAGEGQFLGVDWGSFVLVFVVAFVASVLVVASYSLGLRLLATGSDRAHRPPIATAGAYLCIAVGIAAVLYGIYLVIPQFHS
ncbi:hypothetical protein [Herbiconiux sp.]|uniref:hypothetical protein n=1 Tax=Herbiconiux sp. TaxID=1871186 RepID=UPI0025B9391E|nr:hypothetical protein [Herbiconiux sp.]